MAKAQKKTVQVFYSYAHKDEALRNELEKHLAILRHQGRIVSWYDRKITPGADLTIEINDHLDTADIILFLISPDFLASDYCYTIEVKRALERNKSGEARVIPVVLRPTDWKDSPFGGLQPLPANSKPITTWRPRDQGFLEVTLGIKAVITALEEQSTKVSKGPTTTAAIILADIRDYNRYQEALFIYNSATQQDPTDAFAHRIMGSVFYELKQYKEMLAAYAKALSLNPNDVLTYLCKGDVLAKLNRTEEALLAYEHAIQLNPKEATSYSRKGNMLYKLKRDGAALAAYEQAIYLNPVDTTAYAGKGDIFF